MEIFKRIDWLNIETMSTKKVSLALKFFVNSFSTIVIILHQVQVHLQPQQQNNLSLQLQRQQVLSATPAQLSQVKAFVSQAQLQASLSRSNSPLGATAAAAAVQHSIKSSIAAAISNTPAPSASQITTQGSSDSVVVTREQKQPTTVQLQASMVSK